MGTMAQADRKELKTALIIFSSIFFVIDLLFLVNIGDNFFHYYYKHAAAFWNVAAIISAVTNLLFLWTKFGKIENTAGAIIPAQQIALWAWPLLNFFLFAGWKFPLP